MIEKIKKRVTEEFETYKEDVLRYGAQAIWDLSTRISFYCCVAEYFDNAENLPKEFLTVLEPIRHPIYLMWTEYLKDETLQYARFEDIENILKQMANMV